jgi:hypothetical protein
MRFFVHSLAIICIFFSNIACSKNSQLVANTKLLFAVEERDFTNEQETSYKVFANGILEKTILHNTKNQAKLFSTTFLTLKKDQVQQAEKLLSEIKNTKYQNFFPWKEDLYSRGNVYKISFVGATELEYLKRTKQQIKTINHQKILYYYQGHEESPEIFKTLIDFIKTNSN